jgi:hypothetical protein
VVVTLSIWCFDADTSDRLKPETASRDHAHIEKLSWSLIAQGRKTNREKGLHGRTILITAAFHFNIVVSLFGDTTLFSGGIHPEFEWINPVKLPSPVHRAHTSYLSSLTLQIQALLQHVGICTPQYHFQ